MKSKGNVLLLAFFLGSIGVHRFYLGQKVVGFIFILLFFFITPIALLIGLIDFVYFTMIDKETFNKSYNSKVKICDDCLADIDIEAKKCKYCGSNV